MKKLVLYSLFAFLLLSCTISRPDVSKIKVNVKINRFDRNLFSADINNLDSNLKDLSVKYGRYWLMYNKGVLRTGNPSNKDFTDYIKKFIFDRNIREVYDSCSIVFENVEKEEKELEMAFRYVKYYFPK